MRGPCKNKKLKAVNVELTGDDIYLIEELKKGGDEGTTSAGGADAPTWDKKAELSDRAQTILNDRKAKDKAKKLEKKEETLEETLQAWNPFASPKKH